MTQLITPPTLFRASAPPETLLAELGPLCAMPGTWVGKGFNLIAVPYFSQADFNLELNASQETMTFTPTGAQIPDRGSQQGDIFFVGLHYFQQVSDALRNTALHVETGMWMNVPATTVPPGDPCVIRMSTIPHGDSLLAQGAYSSSDSGFTSVDPTDAIPFTLDQQFNRVPVTDPNILSRYQNAQMPDSDIPAGSQFNPNLVLNKVLADQQSQNITMQSFTVLQVNANPVGGINGTPIVNPPENIGGLVNMPFINTNVGAANFSATFWIETMEFTDKSDPKYGQTFMQLQYTQTALLAFPASIQPGNPVALWPHISVGTLVQQ